jgi:hypothetical protein
MNLDIASTSNMGMPQTTSFHFSSKTRAPKLVSFLPDYGQVLRDKNGKKIKRQIFNINDLVTALLFLGLDLDNKRDPTFTWPQFIH